MLLASSLKRMAKAEGECCRSVGHGEMLGNFAELESQDDACNEAKIENDQKRIGTQEEFFRVART